MIDFLISVIYQINIFLSHKSRKIECFHDQEMPGRISGRVMPRITAQTMDYVWGINGAICAVYLVKVWSRRHWEIQKPVALQRVFAFGR